MRVLVTGATGFVGFAVAEDLIAAGHGVLGLARTADGARALEAMGAEARMGDLTDPAGLARVAAEADGVIHCAFDHDFSRFAASCALDREAIDAIGGELAGSDRPFVVTSGIGMLAPGRAATEQDEPRPVTAAYPRVSEQTALGWADRGVNVAVVRLPQVHDPEKQGFVSYLVAIARERGVSAYLGEGVNRWAAVHRRDAARVYRLALEQAGAERRGARYHAVGEEGVAMKEIAEAIGRKLSVPVTGLPAEEAAGHFGFLGGFAGLDMPASNTLTREWLGWRPVGPGLIADLDAVRG